MKKIVLIGGGGHCKVVIDIIKNIREYDIVGITEKKIDADKVLDVPIIGDDSVLKNIYKSGVEYAFISLGAIDNVKLREKLYKKVKNIGFKVPKLIHKSAVVSPYAKIGEGTCVMAGAVINAGVKVGNNSIINTGSIIEHDCIIGDNVQISPGAILAGNIKVKNNSLIGMGSNIIQGVTIGENVTIGAGAVVINDIPDNLVAVGMPAKIIRKKEN